jgi:O-antigen/teichoic acid export membrane protein
LYAGAYAVEQAYLAEGGHGDEALLPLMKRAAKVLGSLTLPAAVVLAVSAHWVLLVFGHVYSTRASGELVVLVLGGVPFAAELWLTTALKLAGRLRAIALCNTIYSLVICSAAWLLAPLGLTYVGLAWALGSSLALAAAALAVFRAIRQGAFST